MASRVVGIKELRDLLKDFPARIESKVLHGALRAGGGVIKAAVKAAAPVGEQPSPISAKFGHLRDNLRVIRLKLGIPKGSARYRVDTGKAPQGVWYEFGTSRQPARPFWRPAVDSSFERAVTRIKESISAGMKREIDKMGR